MENQACFGLCQHNGNPFIVNLRIDDENKYQVEKDKSGGVDLTTEPYETIEELHEYFNNFQWSKINQDVIDPITITLLNHPLYIKFAINKREHINKAVDKMVCILNNLNIEIERVKKDLSEFHSPDLHIIMQSNGIQAYKK